MKKYLILLIALVTTVAFSQTEPLDTDADGFRNITNLSHLQWISENSTSWNLNYELDNDIDAYDTREWNDSLGWSPIGNQTTNFTGKFNGNGYTITNLFINNPTASYVGFFGKINSTESIISNMNLTDIDYTGDNYIGGLAGNVIGGYIQNVLVSGTISGSYNIGGIAGDAYGTILHRVISNIDISGEGYLGGIAGVFEYGSEIRHSFSEGSISGTATRIGGLIGNTYSYETIISDCYSSVDVSGITYIGGLVGYHQTARVYRSFSYGSVVGTGATLGGLIGWSNGNTYYSYWDTNTSGQETSAGGTGKTTSEMKQLATYPQLDFNYLWGIDNNYPTFQNLSAYDMPESVELSSLSGSGTESDPYIITTADEMNAMRNNLSAYYKLGNDIDLSSSVVWDYGRGWQPIGSSESEQRFSGSFDGDNYKIIGMSINRPLNQYQGLFAYLQNSTISNTELTYANLLGKGYTGTLTGYANNSTITNISVETTVVSAYSTIGGVVGETHEGRMSRISADVNIFAESYAGGIAGYLGEGFDNDGSDLRYSFAKGLIKGISNLGGLIGKTYNEASVVADCYSNVDVTGVNTIGGLVGYHQVASIYRCYSNGSVVGSGSSIGGLIGAANGRTYYSYWDTLSSGVSTSAGGTGKSTSDMKQMVTFDQFDFDYTWQIDEGNDYPVFKDLSIYNYPVDLELSELDGSGTELDPYIITNINELNTIRKDLVAYYKLGNDIDMSSSILWNVGEGWEPIGTSTSTATKFKGTLDGAGYRIVGLHISRPLTQFQGLFGYIDSANVSNMKLTKSHLLVGKYSGTLTGYSATSNIEHVSVQTQIISVYSQIGGIVGEVHEGGLYYVYGDVNIYASSYSGGLVGYLGEGYDNDGADLYNSFVTGKVTGNSNIGGLVGKTYNGATRVTNCYSRADVYSTYTSGGIVGYNQVARIYYCYSTGLVDGEGTSLGGLVGGANGSTIYSYWDKETSGRESSAGGVGKLTENMVYPYSGVVYQDWDFTNTWASDVDSDINDGYPYLQGFDEILFIDAPVLNSPADESVDVSVSTNLTWNSVDNATIYILEIASDDAFENIIETTEITASNYQLDNLNYFTEYYWRVKAENAFIESEWSTVWSFTTVDFTLDAPVLSLPANNSTDMNISIMLEWNSVDDAESYTIELSKNAEFTQIVNTFTDLEDLSVDLNNLDYFTQYYWRAKAVNSTYSTESDWSDIYSFATKEVTDKYVNLKMYFNGFYNGTVHKNVAVLIELRSGDNLMNSNIISKKSTILDDNGECAVNFREVDEGDYWILVRAIGFLPVCTPDKYTLSETDINHDFTTSSSQSIAGTSCMIQNNGEWYIVSGDMNGDRSVGAFDVNKFIPVIGRSVSNQIPSD